MNRSKRLYILLGVLAAVCLLTFAVSRYEEKKEKIKNSDEIILEIDSDDVTSLSWENDTASLAFHKDEKWIYDGDEAFPVSTEKIEELLGKFQEFGVSFVIEDVEDYSQYGLDEPLCTIKIKAGDKEYEIQLGDYSQMDSERYVSVGDGNVYLVKEDPLAAFELELKDMIQADEIPDLSITQKIRFQGAEDYKIVYEEESKYTYCADDVYFVKDGEERLPLDTDRVNAYIDTVEGLDFSNYVTYNATEEELEKYGLDEPELRVKMEYAEPEDSGEDDSGETLKEFTLHVSRDSEEDTAYVRVDDSPVVYKITQEEYEALMKAGYDDLRHQEVLTADFADIQAINISLEDKSYQLEPKEEDGETVWYYGDKKAEPEDLKSALSGLKISEFKEETPTQKEEIGLTVHLDNENYKEVSIRLYRYDSKSCLVVLDGEPLGLADRELVVDFVEAVNGIILD